MSCVMFHDDGSKGMAYLGDLGEHFKAFKHPT